MSFVIIIISPFVPSYCFGCSHSHKSICGVDILIGPATLLNNNTFSRLQVSEFCSTFSYNCGDEFYCPHTTNMRRPTFKASILRRTRSYPTALDNLHRFICHKTQPTKPSQQIKRRGRGFMSISDVPTFSVLKSGHISRNDYGQCFLFEQ